MKKFIALILVALVAFSSVGAMAASGKATRKASATPLVLGTTYDFKDSKTYKLTLKQDSLVTLTRSKFTDTSYFTVSRDAELQQVFANYGLYDEDVYNGTLTLALAKGTYYIVSWGAAKSGKFKFQAVKNVDQKNYCPARAVELKANTSLTVGKLGMNNYKHWYKINVTKKQKITLTRSGDANAYIELYNADLGWVEMESYGSAKKITRKKVEPGTYYISVDTEGDAYVGYAATFKWK